jgi:hypothetical protein
LLQAKKYDRAIALLVKHGWWERLLTLMRSLDKISDVKPITAAVAALRRAGAICLARLSHLHSPASLSCMHVLGKQRQSAMLATAVSVQQLSLPHVACICTHLHR